MGVGWWARWTAGGRASWLLCLGASNRRKAGVETQTALRAGARQRLERPHAVRTLPMWGSLWMKSTSAEALKAGGVWGKGEGGG